MDQSKARATAGSQSRASELQAALNSLQAKIDGILPPRYVGCFEDVPAKSMGSAVLKYDSQGRVAWGAIWTTFCHLALAGGPPHRGRLLAAVPASEAIAHPAEQAAVVAELKRAIQLSADLPTLDDQPPGWVAIDCTDADMAAWLVRAIVAENVTARHERNILLVPAGPHFRIEKEVKNVVVCVAKTIHYLLDHVAEGARPRGLSVELIEPPLPEEVDRAPQQYRSAADQLRQRLAEATTLSVSESEVPGWIGIECQSDEMAVWLQRAIIAGSILARRENAVLFVPIVLGDRSQEACDKVVHVACEALTLWQFSTSQ